MRPVTTITFALLTILVGCTSKDEFQINIESTHTTYDTLYIRELTTERAIAKIPLRELNKEYTFKISEGTLAQLSVKGGAASYLTIIRPGARKIVTIDSTSIGTRHSLPDSLMNYLWKSTNQMFSRYDKLLFAQDDPEKVLSLFEDLIQTRGDKLSEFKSKLTDSEFAILESQNSGQVYSFLLFYGRTAKGYSPDSDFYGFIEKIENDNIYSKYFPLNLLYKFEIQYLREVDSIQSIESFFTFIEQQTAKRDLQDFLKAIYLKSVIEYPFYWERHEILFTSNTIEEARLREGKNIYADLIDKASNSFFTSQNGVKGFDFTANKLDGTEFRLSDLKGKIVVIDMWATWCAPCIAQRPNMLAIANKYHGNPEVAILMVSVDHSVDRWQKYVKETNEHGYGLELNIPDGMNTQFGDKYLIKAVPRYFLIDKEGVIVDSHLPEPSVEMERVIERESGKL